MRAERLTAQLLSGPKASTPAQAVGQLLAVQGQDPRGFRLAVRVRTDGVAAEDVDAALTKQKTLVVSWLNRGTLHLVCAEDYWWLHPVTTPQLATGNRSRLAQEGVSPKQADKGAAVIAAEVSASGPRTRSELRAALDKAKVPTAGQAFVHLLVAASLRGDLIRGPIRGKEQCFVSAAEWLGQQPAPLDRDEALGLLARRYLVGHGPATVRDLAKWAGIILGDAKTGIAQIADVVEETDGLFDLPDRPKAAPLPSPRLLGPFDPVLCGWESRDPIVGHHEGIVTNNGLFRPFALVNGRAVATWGLDTGKVTIRPLEQISQAVRRKLIKDAAAVLDYLGLPATEALWR